MLSIDADAHVIECEKTWDYLEGPDKRYRPVPIAVDMPTGKKSNFWIIGGRLIGGRDNVGQDTSKESREMANIDSRLKHMDDIGTGGEAETDGAVRLRVPDEGETVVHDLIRGDTSFAQRPPRRPRDRPCRRERPLQLRRRGRRPRRARSRTSCAARTTSPTRPSSCSSTRRWAPSRRVFAHLPLLHGPDGKKLSKRHGAASVQELRDAGYLPEAVRNYLALLGWGSADDETIISHRRADRAVRHRARVRRTRRSSTSRSCAG